MIVPKINRDACVGVGNCVAIAPDVFEMDDQDKAIVVNPQGADEDTLWKAAESCPVDAVILEDDTTGEVVHP